MKIIAFGASSSKKSINKEFAAYTANKLQGEIEIADLNDYPLPLYSVDVEQGNGIPENAIAFYKKLDSADLIIISLAEHNGSYTAVFKNLFDWLSRYKMKMFEGKQLILLSTSTGFRGGKNVLKEASERFPRHGADIIGTFSLSRFAKNYNSGEGIVDNDVKGSFDAFLKCVKDKI